MVDVNLTINLNEVYADIRTIAFVSSEVATEMSDENKAMIADVTEEETKRIVSTYKEEAIGETMVLFVPYKGECEEDSEDEPKEDPIKVKKAKKGFANWLSNFFAQASTDDEADHLSW